MLALADPPPVTEPDLIPGLKYPPAWHRLEESRERAFLDAHTRWHLRYGLLPVRRTGEHR